MAYMLCKFLCTHHLLVTYCVHKELLTTYTVHILSQYWPKSYVPPLHDLVCIVIFMDYFVHLRLLGKLIFTLEILYDHVHARLVTYSDDIPPLGDLLPTKGLFDGIFCTHTNQYWHFFYKYHLFMTLVWPLLTFMTYFPVGKLISIYFMATCARSTSYHFCTYDTS